MSKAKTFFKLFRPKGGSNTFLQKLLLPFYLSKVQTSKIFCRILLMKNHFSKVQSFLNINETEKISLAKADLGLLQHPRWNAL